MRKSIADVLADIGKETSRKKKVAMLQQATSSTMKLVLGYAFDPRVRWRIPPGPLPQGVYKPTRKEMDLEGTMFHSSTHRIFSRFVYNQQHNNLPDWKVQQLFIQTLETLDPDDADMVIAMKDGSVGIPGITFKLVKEAFPSFTADWGDETRQDLIKKEAEVKKEAETKEADAEKEADTKEKATVND